MQILHIRAFPFVIGVAAIVWALCRLLPGAYQPDAAAVRVDMEASAGRHVELFLNDIRRPPQSQPIAAGVRRVYTFPVPGEDISLLRLDPTDAAGAEVRVYSVEVVDGAGVLAQYDPRSLARWNRSNTSLAEDVGEVFRIVAGNSDPILQTAPNLVLRRQAPAWFRQTTALLTTESLHVTSVVGLALVLLTMAWHRSGWVALPLIAAAAATTAIVLPRVAALPFAPPPIDVAVGRAAFRGLSVTAGQVATVVVVACAALIGSLTGLVMRRWNRQDGHTVSGRDEPVPPAPGAARDVPGFFTLGEDGRWWQVAGPLAVCLLIAATVTPDLGALVQSAASYRYAPHWDSDNLLYWATLSRTGLLPFRDYWYPYSGFYTFYWSLPAGPWIRASYDALVLGTFFLAVTRLAGGHAVPALAATVFLWSGDQAGAFPSLTRYLLSTNLVLTFVAMRCDAPRIDLTRVMFWGAFGLALFFEPIQLLHGSVAIAALLLWRSFEHGWRWREIARLLIRALGVPAGLTLAYLALLALSGQLAGFLRFHLRLADTAAYSAWPTEISATTLPWESLAFALFAAPACLVTLGVFLRVARDRRDAITAEVCLGTGLLAVMLLQKHVVRTYETQLRFIVPLAVLLVLLRWRGRRRGAYYAAVGVVAGVLAAAATQTGGLQALARQAWTAPQRLADTVRLVTVGSTDLRTANAAWLDRGRLASYGDENLAFDRLGELGGDRLPEAFVLTDAPVLYRLLRQTVYHANMYNASPLYEQETVADWLTSRRIPYVLVDPRSLDFDGFPRAVRLPLVFNVVVADYVPGTTAGRFDVLRRRGRNEAPALAYWRERLGTSLPLGRLASRSTIGRRATCTPDTPACEDVAAITLAVPPPAPFVVTVPFDAGGLRFQVTFDAVAGQREYHVNLDRVWFWTLQRAFGDPPRLAREELMAGVSVSIDRRRAMPRTLY